MPQNVWLALVLRGMLDLFLLLQSTVQFCSALEENLVQNMDFSLEQYMDF